MCGASRCCRARRPRSTARPTASSCCGPARAGSTGWGCTRRASAGRSPSCWSERVGHDGRGAGGGGRLEEVLQAFVGVLQVVDVVGAPELVVGVDVVGAEGGGVVVGGEAGPGDGGQHRGGGG